MSPYAHEPESLRVAREQARTIQRVQNSVATIIVLLSLGAAVLLLMRGCQEDYRGWSGDAHSLQTAQ